MNSVIYIMGVAGSGKTTIGKLLSSEMGIPYFDADDFHSPLHISKMKAGFPLTDEDRKLWLEKLNKLGKEQSEINGAIIGCSALKEKYRKVLEAEIKQTFWIFLQGNYDTIQDRLKKRRNHFMPPQLLQSQFESLEIPVSGLIIDIKKDPPEIINIIVEYLEEEIKNNLG